MGGIVFYANYLRYMERARTEFLRQSGIEQAQLARERELAFVVRSVAVDYLAPAGLDDELRVGCILEEQRRASLVFAQPIFRAGESPEKPLCTGLVRIACVDRSRGRPVPVPTDVIEALHREH